MLCPNDFIASDGYPKVFIDDSEQMMDDVPQLIDKNIFTQTQSAKQVYYEILLELRNKTKYQWVNYLLLFFHWKLQFEIFLGLPQ